MTQIQQSEPLIYQGQFGEFTITQSDRQGVIIYRAGLMIAALSFAIGTALVLRATADGLPLDPNSAVLKALTPLYACFCVGLGVSLLSIHIYLASLHRLLQAFWAIGVLASVVVAWQSSEPFALFV